MSIEDLFTAGHRTEQCAKAKQADPLIPAALDTQLATVLGTNQIAGRLHQRTVEREGIKRFSLVTPIVVFAQLGDHRSVETLALEAGVEEADGVGGDHRHEQADREEGDHTGGHLRR